MRFSTLARQWMILLVAAAWLGTTLSSESAANDQAMRISIDVRQLPRKLVHADLNIPIETTTEEREVALWYPKWVPGSHGPGGPIANLAGLQIHTVNGQRLTWKRSPGEVYRLLVKVPAGENELRVSIRYITDQPTTTSFGHDCFGSQHIGVISPGALLLYPEGANIDVQTIHAEVRLPAQWVVATALPGQRAAKESEPACSFEAVTLRTLVDSPIMCGRYYRAFELATESDLCPPHTLHVFADDESTTNLNQDVVGTYRSMVAQTAHLIGSHPFDRFDILLAVTNSLPKNGLEHSRSTFNVLPPQSLQSPGALKGWDRLLVPHEYLHAWCGKFRRPAGMLTTDFHTPKDTELLWVYEGLTQYLGELVEARSGMMSADEFRHRLFVELRNATHQQGRQWRPLVDTAAASHILRDASPSWSGLRRSQDYYMEGMLFWIEADARIRQITGGKKTLDDFCHDFFQAPRSTTLPKPFTRGEIVERLRAIAEFDWDGLIARRVESYQQAFDPAVAELLGYRFEFRSTRPEIPAATFRHSHGIDLLDSVGASFTPGGEVRTVLLDSPADRARLAPALQVIGVAGHKWSGPRLVDAVRNSAEGRAIELLVARGEQLETVQIQYYDGARYWNLTRDESQPDLLSEILKPKS